MNFEKLVEQKIREAMAKGEFDHLEGEGQPIDLTAYFSTPEEWRAGYAVLKQAGVVPEEMELRREINLLKQQIESCDHNDQRQQLRKKLAELTLKYDILIERNQKTRPR